MRYADGDFEEHVPGRFLRKPRPSPAEPHPEAPSLSGAKRMRLQPPPNAGSFSEGMKLWARDPKLRWAEAQVVQVDTGDGGGDVTRVRVSYKGFARKHDEWIRVGAGRLRPYADGPPDDVQFPVRRSCRQHVAKIRRKHITITGWPLPFKAAGGQRAALARYPLDLHGECGG